MLLINDWIYKELPPQVLPKLQELNPKSQSGHRKYEHHQHLKVDTGIEHLDKQIVTVTTLMRVSRDIREFRRLFARAFDKPQQGEFSFVDSVEELDKS